MSNPRVAFDPSNRFVIFSREMAENWKVNRTYAVISICDSLESGGTQTWQVKDGYEAILRLRFDDIMPHQMPPVGQTCQLRLFDELHAEDILVFWEAYKDHVDRFMIHCNAGISRSAGVGAALSVLENVPDDPIYRSCQPNAHVKSVILQLARKRGIL